MSVKNPNSPWRKDSGGMKEFKPALMTRIINLKRAEPNLTQKEISARLKCGESTVNHILNRTGSYNGYERRKRGGEQS